jgi:hypothetical protein
MSLVFVKLNGVKFYGSLFYTFPKLFVFVCTMIVRTGAQGFCTAFRSTYNTETV